MAKRKGGGRKRGSIKRDSGGRFARVAGSAKARYKGRRPHSVRKASRLQRRNNNLSRSITERSNMGMARRLGDGRVLVTSDIRRSVDKGARREQKIRKLNNTRSAQAYRKRTGKGTPHSIGVTINTQPSAIRIGRV